MSLAVIFAAVAATNSSLLNLLIWFVVLGLIFYVIWWALGQFALPEPFNKIIRVIVVLICAILLINIMLGLIDHQFIRLG